MHGFILVGWRVIKDMKPKELKNAKEKRQEKKDFAREIGKHLRKIREAKGVSQEKLSLDSGYYHTYVNKIEQGKYSPSLHTIWRLAYTLGLSLRDFFQDF